VAALAADLAIAPLTARVLAGRGIDDVAAGRSYLQARLNDLPDPFLLSGMAPAVDRLVRAVVGSEPILVHGDYDVDGITGSALLVETLRSFGAIASFHLPLRLRDGYGLSAEALRSAAMAGVRVVVSVDCGITAMAEAELARGLGLDLIITDHHLPPETLPPALAIVNPQLPGDSFPGKELAGVGVAFFLLIALRKSLREAGHFAGRSEPDLRRFLDLVALGTIADLVPLIGVNRILTRAGLLILENGERPGIVALREVAGVRRVTCGAVGFQLAPRLNAAGRLEDAALGVRLLLETSPQEALVTARKLDACNLERRKIEEDTLGQALDRLLLQEEGGKTIVLADQGWHPGVIGIVASRLVERFYRPTVLIALENGAGKGSARSIKGFHLFRALQDCTDHLDGFGGHAAAAGLSLAEDRVAAFAAAFERVAGECLGEQDLQPVLGFDGEVLLEELTAAAIDDLAGLAPCGMGNPEPAFVVRGVLARQGRVVGTGHLRFTAQQDGYSLPCIAWRMAERAESLAGPLDLLFTPEINEWHGRRQLQLRIRDLRPSGDGEG
jgi:single-stranded-DNA-specific exonuclease